MSHFTIPVTATMIVGLMLSFSPFVIDAAPGRLVEKGSIEHIQSVTRAVDDDMLINADQRIGDWLTYGRTYREDRYSPLTGVNKNNVGELGLAWSIDLGTKRGIQATPIVVDGIMFLTGPWSVVYAIDTRKGEIIWTFEPEVDRNRARSYCCGVVNRGVAVYKGSIFVATLDGRLISIDAARGTENWSTQTFQAEGTHYSITGAPRVYDGKVLIGNAGAEYNVRGFVSAYDARSGNLEWRFYTVPGNPDDGYEHADLEAAAKTWTGEWWLQGGGGTVWDSMAYDPELQLVYIGVGNGSHWDRLIRSPGGGDNLYLSSIVALDIKTGEYVWHYQTTPGDSWDYTATQTMTLAELEVSGKQRKVLMQAPKNGFFYVIDRETGEYIQAEPYTYVSWASRIDDTGRPVETPSARYRDGKSHWITPGSHGGHNWQPQAYDPKAGLVYIPTVVRPGAFSSTHQYGYGAPEGAGHAIGLNISMSTRLYVGSVYDKDERAPPPGQSTGRLIAFDPIKLEEVWGIDMPFHYNGGLLATAAGLVMQVDATGIFSIRDNNTGQALWTFDVRSGGIAPPVTYLVDGEQYISVAVGWGGAQGGVDKAVERIHPGTVYTFRTGGDAPAPTKLPAEDTPLTDLAGSAAPEKIGRGVDLFMNNCIGCHSLPGAGGGAVPDIARASTVVLENLEAVLLAGAYVSQGMPSFSDVFTGEDVGAIRAFVLHAAKLWKEGVDPAEQISEYARLQKLANQ